MAWLNVHNQQYTFNTICSLFYMHCRFKSPEYATNRNNFRSIHQEVFLGKDVLKICNQFPGDHPCQSAISIKLLFNFIEITLQHVCSPVNLLHIFRTPFLKNKSRWLLLQLDIKTYDILLCGHLISMSQ